MAANLKNIEDLRSYLKDKENDQLFVLNTSHLNGTRRRSECAVTIEADGRSQHIVIKDTFIPQDIAYGFSTLEAFLRSRDFIRFVETGFIQVIDADVAQAYLKTPEARTEYMRISGLEDEAHIPPSTGNTRNITANIKVVSIMANAMDSARKLSALKNISSELTKDDKTWIMSQAKDDNIKSYIQSLK